MPHKSAFIVIEGSDGSGKGTHFNLLRDWLKAEAVPYEAFDFPQYGEPSAYFVEKYLNGGYGTSEEVGAYKASLFYALDRFDASAKIRHALDNGKVVLCNRYVASNMGHQGAKLPTAADRKRYFEWNEKLEFDALGIPRPDLNIVLQMPAEIAQQFVDHKPARGYLSHGKSRDIHEDDLEHLKAAAATYAEICELFPKTFTPIDCAQDGSVRDIGTIQENIRALVAPLIGVDG
jgi:dTMP kinase